jgi:SAM-dependent methyltransferase
LNLPPNKNSGYCHCCRHDTVFTAHGDWLRDTYLCDKCGSIPRQRAIQYILDRYFTNWTYLNIHESSPSNEYISQWCSSYSSSQYLEGVALGSVVDVVRCENLEKLTFADETFDLVITQDVMEHVNTPQKAFNSIMRVIKRGGAHVFTAPKHRGLLTSYPRILVTENEIVHIKEPEYHGSPVGDGRVLVTWDYGDDFESLVTEWAGCPIQTYVTRDRALGLDGEYLEVFVMKKI